MMLLDRMQAHRNKRSYRAEDGRLRIVVRRAWEGEPTYGKLRRHISLPYIFCCSFILTIAVLYLLMVLAAR